MGTSRRDVHHVSLRMDVCCVHQHVWLHHQRATGEVISCIMSLLLLFCRQSGAPGGRCGGVRSGARALRVQGGGGAQAADDAQDDQGCIGQFHAEPAHLGGQPARTDRGMKTENTSGLKSSLHTAPGRIGLIMHQFKGQRRTAQNRI